MIKATSDPVTGGPGTRSTGKPRRVGRPIWYFNADGTPAFAKQRYEPGENGRDKSFKYAYKRDGATIWAKPDGADALLYALPELVAALASGDPVHWCEGESDAQALMRAGVVATTHHQGASHATAAQAEWFAGTDSDVTLHVDRDQGGIGAADAWRRYNLLLDVGLDPDQIRFVKAKRGKDIRDHLEAGLTVDQVVPVDKKRIRLMAEKVTPESAARDGYDVTWDGKLHLVTSTEGDYDDPDYDPDKVDVEKHKRTLRVQDRARAEFAVEKDARLMLNVADRKVGGGDFILDTEDSGVALWGDDQHQAWRAGQGLVIVGPQGVGKSVTEGRLLLARAGLSDPYIFGLPVAPDARPSLLLAMDRPSQIAESLRRMVGPENRALLNERLLVWKGPLPFSILREPRALADWIVTEYGVVGCVAVDSYKDLNPRLSAEEVGGGINLAAQEVLARDMEWIGLHHQRKAQADNKRPDTLNDVYGNMMLTSGMGSVVLLWGTAGSATVEFKHLKPLGEPVPDMELVHDRDLGTLERGSADDSVYALLERAGGGGMTKAALAKALHRTDDRAAIKRIDRALDKIGWEFLVAEDGPKSSAGGTPPKVIYLRDARP